MTPNSTYRRMRQPTSVANNSASERREHLTPKRPQTETAGMADAFPYYAGFSFDWACTVLKALGGNSGTMVLDPWNGSGTTTLAAQFIGLSSVGIDLNPVASIVAKLRSSPHDKLERISASAADSAPPGDHREDALDAWFDPPSSHRLRQWANLSTTLVQPNRSLLLTALFRAVRELTTSFEGSNPTWVRRARSDEELISVAKSEIDDEIERNQAFLIQRFASNWHHQTTADIATGDARNLPLLDSTIDAVLTSPPYLTRIDYAIAYARELAVLGLSVYKERKIRSSLMGTTLIRPQHPPPPMPSLPLGSVATDLVWKIAHHSSYASQGYYLKQAHQYLSDLSVSLDEITRVTKPEARMYLVVQDSYYKDVHVQLADICVEECERRGWSLAEKAPVPVTRSLTTLNRAAKKYKKGTVEESVVMLTKSGA